ncbi:ribonuclease H-like domain-containing protein [Phlebopus sp. FC_14]|nr:ribonuclease H-like domain-containing protein [Phlebopus sp. FC_14]
MPKASKPGFYAVRKGRQTGIYLTWLVATISEDADECEAQVKGFAGAIYKKLTTEADARDFLLGKTSTTSTTTVAPASTSKPVPLPVPLTSRTTVHTDSNAASNGVESSAKGGVDFDAVYCDGACKGNGQSGSVAGIGVWWGHNDPRNISERCPGDQTNNRAELIAIVRILETVPPLKRRLVIRTDSKYSIQCVTSWIFKWMQNGFLAADGKPVKNRALIKYLTALLHARRTTSQVVEFEHVRGHVGIQGNEAADQLANLGATKPVMPERDWQKLEEISNSREVLVHLSSNLRLASFEISAFF